MGDSYTTDEPRPQPGRPLGWWPLAITAALIGASLLVAPRLLTVADTDQAPPVTAPRSFSERAPFSEPLDGAIAYLNNDREFMLVDLTTGDVIGTKGVPAGRRPAAASTTRAYFGRVSALRPDGNWDHYKSLPWNATEYRNHASGDSIAYSAQLDTVAAAMSPLPQAGNGVVLAGEDESVVAASSAGRWGFAVWTGDRLLVRELTADTTNWWLIDGAGARPNELVQLPDDFLPIAGTEGLVVGQLHDGAAIADLTSGKVTALDGPFSWAVDLSEGSPLVATIGGESATLFVYDLDGGLKWSEPLAEPVTRFRGGLSWSPDGSYLVVVSGGTLAAFDRDGRRLGTFLETLPAPQGRKGTSFVEVVERP